MIPPPTYEALSSAVNQTLLDPELTNSQVVEMLEVAKRQGVAVVTVRPCDVDLATRVLAGSAVRAGAVAGYPYGFQSTGVKLYELRDLLRRGAQEVSAVLGLSRLLSREFQHVQTELNQMTESCRGEGARLTVMLDVARLSDELKIIAYTCCERAAVDYVAAMGSCTPADLALMRKHLPEETGLQASAEALDAALELQALGCARIATAGAAGMLDEWRRRVTRPTA
jgi:deoxyribose-phosphate aldolase